MSDDQPPSLNESDDYERWRDNLQQWRCCTTMESKRQALTVRSKLSGRARDIALNLDAADLNNENGMEYLLEQLDATFRKTKKNKWDVSAVNKNNQIGRKEPQSNGASNMTAAERARQRAAELSAKLAKEGKYQTNPMSLLPAAVSNPVDQFKMVHLNSSVVSPVNLNNKPKRPSVPLPEVTKIDTGGYFAKLEINDMPARPFLIKHTTHELILQKTGCGASLHGRYMNPEEKRKQIVSGLKEMPLTLFLEADISAKVQVAVHKVMDVCRNYEKNPDNATNNYGLTGNPNQHQQNNHHFVQDKLFIGLDHVNPQFDVKSKLLGNDAANFGFITQQTGAKIFLRGKGSGYLEQNSGRESFEALHVYISHPRQDGLVTTRQLCSNLIETVRNQYHEWQNSSSQGHNDRPRPNHASPAQAYNSAPGLQARKPMSDLSYRAAPPPQELYQQRPRFENFHRPQFSVNHQRPAFAGYPPHPANMRLQYPPQSHQQAPQPSTMEAGRNYGGNYYNYRHGGRGDEGPSDEQSRESKYREDRRRNRSRSPRERRQRSRSRSPPKSPSRISSNRSPSRSSPSNRNSSPDGRSPPQRSVEKSSEKTRRRFTEEPKKRRKFSEDPKLLEQSKRSEGNTKLESSNEKSSTQPSSKSRPKFTEKPRTGFAMPPPPSSKSPLKVVGKKTNDVIFKPPAPIVQKPSSAKALRMGALGSLTAYDDDSD